MSVLQIVLKAFDNFSVEHSPRHFDASETHALELVDFPSGDTDASSSTEIEHIPSNRIHLTSVESSNASTSAPPHMHDEITRSSGSSALIESNRTGQSRISIFQRYCLSPQSKCDFF